ncbi:MAG: hypothetical protein P1V81_04540 [Planctomycetota bacterium]|nr:hypothetical protein [Planctomycetota bacterium]
MLSEDGRVVAFRSATDDAALGDTNDAQGIFLRGRQLGTTGLISATVTGGSVTIFAFNGGPSATGTDL